MNGVKVYAAYYRMETHVIKLRIVLDEYKGSAWVPAFAGTHTPGRAGQHLDLFDSILDRE